MFAKEEFQSVISEARAHLADIRLVFEVFEKWPDPVVIKNDKDEHLWINEAALLQIRMTREEFLAVKGFEMSDENDVNKYLRNDLDVIERDTPKYILEDYVNGDGIRHQALTMKIPLRIDKGQPIVVVTWRDVGAIRDQICPPDRPKGCPLEDI